MGFLKMFDKLDDIVYEPVKAICEWAKEPLRRFENERNLKSEKEMKAFEQQLAEQERESQAKLEVDIRRWNAEVDDLICEHEMERQTQLIESLKAYQKDLAQSTAEMINSFTKMQIELKEMAGLFIDRRVQSYKKQQEESKANSLRELAEVKEMFFESDPETYRMMVTQILEERKTMVEQTGWFIKELAEDSKIMSERLGRITDQGTDTIYSMLREIAVHRGLDEQFAHQLAERSSSKLLK